MKTILINIFFIPLCALGQNRYLSNYPSFGLEIKDQLVFYEMYPNDFKIFGKCSSYTNCENKFPEQTLMSILSADNHGWDQKNYNYALKNNLEKYKLINDMSRQSVFFKPLVKVTFEWNKSRYAIIKYHIHDNDKVIPSCNILVEKENRWFVIKPNGILTKAYFMFNYLSQKSLNAIFTNKSIGVKAFDEQLESIYLNGMLDFKKALNSTSTTKMTEEELKLVLDPFIN